MAARLSLFALSGVPECARVASYHAYGTAAAVNDFRKELRSWRQVLSRAYDSPFRPDNISLIRETPAWKEELAAG